MERGDRVIENLNYYEKHRGRILAEKAKRIQCPCCIWHAKSNTARHKKSQRHNDRVKAGEVIVRFLKTVI
jgi:hypothetical protein